MALGVNDKTALVLGARGGLGGAVADALAAEGMRIAAADINEAAVKSTCERIIAAGGRALALTWDLADRGVIAANLKAIEAELGPADHYTT